MFDVANRVYTNVKIYVQSLYPEVNFQNADTASPPVFPAVTVKQIDAREVANEMGDSDFDDDYSFESNIEIQCYSNKDITESRKVMTAACKAMRKMNYVRAYGVADIKVVNRPNQYRTVARFRRIVSSLSEIPKFNLTQGGN